MENPLAELNGWWAEAYDDGNMTSRVLVFEHEDAAMTVQFETIDDKDSRARWKLRIVDYHDFVWEGDYGEPQWFSDHVLLAPHQDPYGFISFSQPFANPAEALGAAAQAHYQISEDWVPLDAFLRVHMFTHAFGIVAEGPDRFVAAYTEAIRSIGGNIHLAQASRLQDPSLSVVTWGASYFIARSFELVQIV